MNGTQPNQRSSPIRLRYALNDRVVSFGSGELWEWDGQTDPTRYSLEWAREFRYDGARQRYLNRVLDPADLMLDPPVFTALSETWSDYDGDGVYADFTVNGGTATTTRWYELGLGQTEDPFGTPVTKHYHSDLIGTTRFMSDASGNKIEEAVYTAFGELVSGSPRRYGYAGTWGYQTDDTGQMPFMHVGHRYYDSSTGRFLQRDPIGIWGGLNVYAYAANRPTIAVDPDGKFLGALLAGAAALTVIAAIVLADYAFDALSKLAPDRSKDNEKDNEHLSEDLANRLHDVDNVRDRVEDIVRKTPSTTLTGPSNPPRKIRDWVIGLLLDCAGE